MSEGLYDPLGTAPRPRARSTPVVWIAAVSLAALLGIAGLVMLRGGDDRGEPRAEATIERLPPVVSAPAAAAPAPVAPATVPPAAGMAVPAGAEVEVQNGVRIIRMHPEPPPAPDRAISVPQAPAPAVATRPARTP